MFERPDLPNNSEGTEPDQETLEQREETIELNFSPEDFHKFKEVCEKFKEKTSGPDGLEKFKEAINFGTDLIKKHGYKETGSTALHHIIIGSSGFDLSSPSIKRVDFEGEDSIANFIDNL